MRHSVAWLHAHGWVHTQSSLSSAPTTADGAAELAVDVAASLGCARFAALDDASWQFRRGWDYPAELGPTAKVEPGIEWFAEYERLTPIPDSSAVQGEDLRVSGHRVAIDELRLERSGAQLEERPALEGRILVGTGWDGTPAVWLRSLEPNYTILLLSYALDAAALEETATHVHPVCQQQWLALGGRILTCDPLDPTCPPPTDR